jgi:rSAM/selenodomain-associated transferase 2
VTLCPQAARETRFSIVVPVLHERAHIASSLETLRAQGFADSRQIIVVDGDSQGSTIECVRNKDVLCLKSAPGRACQMNTGAAAAEGQILLFLHVDTVLPPRALEKISRLMATGKCVGGAFDLAIDSDRLFLRYIAMRASFRSRLNRIPYGDQAIFVRRSYFEGLGGFKQIPLMEDVDLMRRIKKDRQRIHIFRDRVMTSPRRWEAEGPLYTTLRNQFILFLYYLGVSPETLSRFYRIQNGRS